MDYSTVLSKTVQEIKPSGIRKFFDIASEMDHVISLSIGEPDFKTPWDIRKKAIWKKDGLGIQPTAVWLIYALRLANIWNADFAFVIVPIMNCW